MKAVQFSQYGGPEVLRVVDADEPHAGPGQVRIAVHAAGINHSDGMKLRSGRWRDRPIPLPSGNGVEGAGVMGGINIRVIFVFYPRCCSFYGI